jgi:flavin-binding protein dodecin
VQVSYRARLSNAERRPTSGTSLACSAVSTLPNEVSMPNTVAKVIEISAESAEGFEQAVRVGIDRAAKTVKDIQSVWIKEQHVEVKNGKVAAFRVHMKVTFLLRE